MSLPARCIGSGLGARAAAALGLGLAVQTGGCFPDPPPPEPRPFSAIQQARFPHDDHVNKLKLACVECHHETDAAELVTPHQEYLAENRVDCHLCHHGTARPREPQSCGACHPSTPPDVADETLSAKVVIHRACWRCHAIGEGSSTSALCDTCHGTTKPPVSRHPKPRGFHPKGPR